MDQIDLFGRHVKSFADLNVVTGNGRSDGRVLATFASQLPAGPVHGNISLDEPLLPETLPEIPSATGWEPPDTEPLPRGDLLDSLDSRRVLVVASGRQQPGFRDALSHIVESIGAPVIADPQCWVAGRNAVAHGDLLASGRVPFSTAPPDVVLRLGAIPTSRSLSNWLGNRASNRSL